MSKYIFLLITALLVGCGPQIPQSELDRVSEEIIDQYLKVVETSKLRVAGTGGGVKDDKIFMVSVSFSIDEVMTLENARRLIVDLALELLNVINSSPDYSKYFKDGHADINVLNICIAGLCFQNNSPPFIRIVSLSDGEVYYGTEREPHEKAPFVDVHEETFEEALAIVKGDSYCKDAPL